jgi:arylsulfatase A-like enzyme
VAITTAALLFSAAATVPSVASAGAPRSHPNILYVLTDDMAYGDLAVMPNVRALIANEGANFTNFFSNVSLCCPSRVTMLRGQYAHNTGVETNGDAGANGGFEAARRLGLERDTVATRLQSSGYRTALFGKYLNHYPGSAGAAYVPPGWTQWASAIDGTPYQQYHYVLNENGVHREYGGAPDDYGTTVYTALTEDLIRSAARDRQPFFVFLSLYAPHEPATPAPGDVGAFEGTGAPRGESFDQQDVSTMPAYIRSLPHLTAAETDAIDALYARRLESLLAVDRAVAQLVAALRDTGTLRNTYIVFSSDNGYHLGEHRLPAGKQTPYDIDTHVPFLVRGPGIGAGTAVTALSGTVDVMPTFLAIAGARIPMGGVRIPHRVDGRSLLNTARARHGEGVRTRSAVLLEHWNDAPLPTRVAVRPPGDGPTEPLDRDQQRPPDVDAGFAAYSLDAPGSVPEYAGVRTARWLYVEYVTGERELYDVVADPEQVRNLAGSRLDTERRLAARVATLRDCRRAACRRADGGSARVA